LHAKPYSSKFFDGISRKNAAHAFDFSTHRSRDTEERHDSSTQIGGLCFEFSKADCHLRAFRGRRTPKVVGGVDAAAGGREAFPVRLVRETTAVPPVDDAML
jgi:hypothetical protein